jgi:hypothetical protein
MPGKKGVKLMPRLSKSGKFNSVKELVFSLLDKNPNIRKQDVDKEVAKEYPTARFLKHDSKRGHFAWYKHRYMRQKLEEADFNIKDGKRESEVPKADGAITSEEDVKEIAPKKKVEKPKAKVQKTK